ncbi:hypothetical protein AAC387_Pa05g3170 [Persea americana]
MHTFPIHHSLPSFLIVLLFFTPAASSVEEDNQPYNDCSPSPYDCGNVKLDISYPFWHRAVRNIAATQKSLESHAIRLTIPLRLRFNRASTMLFKSIMSIRRQLSLIKLTLPTTTIQYAFVLPVTLVWACISLITLREISTSHSSTTALFFFDSTTHTSNSSIAPPILY